MDTSRRTVLLVDDNEINRMILSGMLSEEYDVLEAANGLEAVEILKTKAKDIAVMLLDIVMPKLDGFGVLASMNSNHWIDDIPVIMITSEDSPEFMRRAFDLGAVDYVNRPFDQSILRRRIKNTIMLYSKQKQLLDIVVDEVKNRERESNLMIGILSHIVEFRNGESGKHVQNINLITEMLFNQLMSKTDKYASISGELRYIKLASSLHDIGKIGIPDEIINKPGFLTKDEFEIMKTHTTLGAEAMEKLEIYKNEKLVKYSYEICRWHHERWDGRGYPDGLKGDDIPIAAQIVSLADVYDALTSERCYKEAFSHEKSMEMIHSGQCGQFNPILLECLDDIAEPMQLELRKTGNETGISTDDLAREIKRRISQ